MIESLQREKDLAKTAKNRPIYQSFEPRSFATFAVHIPNL